MILARLTSDEVLDAAYVWLCRRRRDYPDCADIWSFRRDWCREKERLRAGLLAGAFSFGLLDRVSLKDGREIDLWAARDALVLKALAIVLADVLPASRRCTHLRGHGGAKAAVRSVMAALPANRFVFRTDVKSYYASIDHFALLDRLDPHIPDRDVRRLLVLYLRRTAERGGCFYDLTRGISLGCPLSPLIGAFFLHELDTQLEEAGVFSVRFMDDVLVLAPTRWKLRRAVRLVNTVLDRLGLAKHPDKTFVGRIARGFDFLGYHLSRAGLAPAPATLRNAIEHATRLYEQKRGAPSGSAALGTYLRRWNGWLRGGVSDLFLASGGHRLALQPADPEKARQCRD